MRSARFLAPAAALAVGLGAAPSAFAAPSATPSPIVSAAGDGGGPLVFPALLDVRLSRTQTLLDRAARLQDEGQPTKAIASLGSARANLRRAALAAKYLIAHAPPPVVGEDAFHEEAFRPSGRVLRVSARKTKSKKARSAAVGVPTATVYDSAFAVFGLQHQVASTAIGLGDTAGGLLLKSITTTLFTGLDGRDSLIAYIAALPPEVPPVEADSITVTKADDPAPSWGTVMPGVAAHLGDELQLIDGITDANPTLGAGAKRVFAAAEIQDFKAQALVNLTWPAVPAAD